MSWGWQNAEVCSNDDFKKDVVNKMLKIYSTSLKCGFRYFYTYTYGSAGKGFPFFLHADSYKVYWNLWMLH